MKHQGKGQQYKLTMALLGQVILKVVMPWIKSVVKET